jgi:hypothetical protein
MFGLKLPSELKKGAAEEEHSIKKARGELRVPLDPEAGLVWKKNKGGPVWGVKGDAPPEPKKEVSIKLKPAWSTQPTPIVHSIADELAKSKADQNTSQNPPAVRTSAWAVPQSIEPKKVDREPVFQGNAWADEVEADENMQIESSSVFSSRTDDEPARPSKPPVREGGRYSGIIREEVEDRAAREAREAEVKKEPESDREIERDSHSERWQHQAPQPSTLVSERWAERTAGGHERERGSASGGGLIRDRQDSPRSGDGAPFSRDGGSRSFAQPPYDRGQGTQRERFDDQRGVARAGGYGHGYGYANRGYDGSSPRDGRPPMRGESGAGDRYAGGSNVGAMRERGYGYDRGLERYDDARRDEGGQGGQRLGLGAGLRESDSSSRYGDMSGSRPGAYRPPSAGGQQRQQMSRPSFSDMDPMNPNPIDGRGSEGSQDADNRRPRSTSLTEDPRSSSDPVRFFVSISSFQCRILLFFLPFELCRLWRKDSSREASWRKDSPREDANPTIQNSPSQSPSIQPSSVHPEHPDREGDWPRDATGSGGACTGDEETEKDKAAAAAAAAAAAKPPMMILKRPTPPSTPSTSGRLTCEGSERPPALTLSPATKVVLHAWLDFVVGI